MTNKEKEWSERLTEMEADEEFMKWLREYEPDYENEYSGDLLGLYDAFIAGRKCEADSQGQTAYYKPKEA